MSKHFSSYVYMANKRINLSGVRFGKLVAVKFTGDSDKNKSSKWLCVCDCGKETITTQNMLKRGYKKSCGCLHKLPEGESSFNAVFRRYKHQAKKRNVNFKLTKEQFKKLTQKDCFWCGSEPSQEYRRDNANGSFIYNGVDRYDSNKGYILDNCVTSCGKCNVMKNNLTENEFIFHLKKILKHRGQL